MRRTLTNLPVWAEFTLFTIMVTGLSLALGLLIRSLVAEEAGPAEPLALARVEGQRTAVVAQPDRAVVDVFRVPAPEGSSAEAGETEPAASQPTDAAAQAPRTFDGRPLRPARQLSMLVTAYSPDERSCGKWADGVTASGYSVWTNGMKLVAADTDLLPFGTIVTIPGYNAGKPVQVLDRGGKIKGNRLDVLYPTHAIARQWGAQRLTVTVWEYAD